jgi:hypothetical protein
VLEITGKTRWLVIKCWLMLSCNTQGPDVFEFLDNFSNSNPAATVSYLAGSSDKGANHPNSPRADSKNRTMSTSVSFCLSLPPSKTIRQRLRKNQTIAQLSASLGIQRRCPLRDTTCQSNNLLL